MLRSPHRAQSSASAAEGASAPMRIRGRVAQEIGELAGMSNRVITGGEWDEAQAGECLIAAPQ